MKNLKQLLGICEHKWKVIQQTIAYQGVYENEGERPIGTNYYLQCEKCGEVKKKKL